MKTNPPAPACVALNLDNYFYVTPPSTAQIVVTILGTPVTVYPKIDSYTFDFGDDNSLSTSDPGGPYPDGKNIHRYIKSGHFLASVTVHWSADWSAPGIPRRPIPGNTDTQSPNIDVWAHAYRIVLLDDPNANLTAQATDPADPCTK